MGETAENGKGNNQIIPELEINRINGGSSGGDNDSDRRNGFALNALVIASGIGSGMSTKKSSERSKRRPESTRPGEGGFDHLVNFLYHTDPVWYRTRS